MRRSISLCLAAALAATPAASQSGPPSGFTRASFDANARFEQIFLATPTAENARRWLSQLTEEPHVAGTAAEKSFPQG